jgi:hypothetical protein
MRTFIKIYGPPFTKVIEELEKIAIDIPQVCIMDEAISYDIPASIAKDVGGTVIESYDAVVHNYFMKRTRVRVPVERCSKIISESGELLGEFDFFFEWFKDPTHEELKELIQKIDKALKPLGCMYTITTK